MDPSTIQNGSSDKGDKAERLALESKLHHLALVERRLSELDSLRNKVADKYASVLKLRQQSQQQQHQQGRPLNGLSSGAPRPQQHSTTGPALSSLLSVPPATSRLPWQTTPQAANVSATDAHPPISLHDQFLARSDQHADMFLAPAECRWVRKFL